MGELEYPPEAAKGIRLDWKLFYLFHRYGRKGESLSNFLERFILWSIDEGVFND